MKTHALAACDEARRLKENYLMNKLGCIFEQFRQDESGQDLIEYALIVGLIGLVAVTSLNSVATAIGAVFTRISTKLNSVAPASS